MISINYMMSAFLGKWNVTLGIYGLITDRLFKSNIIILLYVILYSYYVYIYIYITKTIRTKSVYISVQI